ncbi:MAG: ribose-phosphate pyrophosphokinase [bacterium]
MKQKLILISGTSNPQLASDIAKNLNVELTPTTIKKFNDGETYVRINESVRGSSVFVIQSTSTPVNDNLMELLITIDALKRASAKEITAVIPYYGYSRQDRKSTSREPITAKLVASMIETAGADRVVAVDLHVDQIQGFFNVPSDNLTAIPILAKAIADKKLKNIVVVAPDAGSATRVRRLADLLLVDLAIINKRRQAHGESKVMELIGDVKNKNAILLDDMIDTGGTIANAAAKLKKQGAKDVYICATHAIFSKDAIKKLDSKYVKEVLVTDTIKLPKSKQIPKIKVVSMAPFISELINCIFQGNPMGAVVEEKYNSVRKINY